MPAPDGTQALLPPVLELRGAVNDSAFPLEVPSAASARADRAALVAQFDDYLLPRLESVDAPLLVVVGGSTGAGKSTLVNSLVGSRVTEPGVLRPTTRAPVLIHHPSDEHWFAGSRILPSLARVTGRAGATGATGTPADGDAGPGAVRLVATESVRPGMALLDAPDIDSVVSANRDLAAQLFSAADLWLFLTTAARYADAVPWELLTQAGQRGTAVAIVLDRVPPEALAEVRDHLAGMLRDQGLGEAPLFTIRETALEDGRLPDAEIGSLRDWLTELATDAAARAEVVRRTLAGALDSLGPRVHGLVGASGDQSTEAQELLDVARQSFEDATQAVRLHAADGSLLRGEVLARWQEFVGTGEFFKQVESTVSRIRDRLASFVRGEPARADDLGEALQSGVEILVRNQAEIATTATARSWRTRPSGAALLRQRAGLAEPSAEFPVGVQRLVRDWQGEILDMVRGEAKDRRTTARVMAYGVNGLGVVLMLVTFASTAGITGAEVGIAGGTAVIGQKLLEAVFGDQAVRTLAKRARDRLVEKVEAVYLAELARYEDAVAAAGVRTEQARELRFAMDAVRSAR